MSASEPPFPFDRAPRPNPPLRETLEYIQEQGRRAGREGALPVPPVEFAQFSNEWLKGWKETCRNPALATVMKESDV